MINSWQFVLKIDYATSRKTTTVNTPHAEVNCSAGFRYVRYVGSSDARCDIAELEFYGHPGEGDNSQLSRLTNLPLVSIHTLDGRIPFDKKTEISENC